LTRSIHLISRPIARPLDQLRCTLKRRPPNILTRPPPHAYRSMHLEAARKDSAVHVSLSSDSLFKQPGAGKPHPRRPGTTKTVEAFLPPTTDRKLGSLLQVRCFERRAITPGQCGAPVGGIYSGDLFMSTRLQRKKSRCAATAPVFNKWGRTLDSASQLAVAPYSGHIPRPCCPIGESSRA